MSKKFSVIVSFALIGFFFVSCGAKKVPNAFGKFEKNYGCIGILPIYNDTSFPPLDELMAGYLNLEMYKKGMQEIITPKDFLKIFREEGNVFFPKRFNRPLAVEYAALLNLDGVFFGVLSSPDRIGSDVSGEKKLLNLEIYFLDSSSSNVVWSYTERDFIVPGDYNSDLRRLSREIVSALLNSGFRYGKAQMPCWDTALADSLKGLPALTKEMFNNLTQDVAESDDENMWLNLGNIFMSLGKRNLALNQYQRYLRLNPVSPFKGEVERQVAILSGK